MAYPSNITKGDAMKEAIISGLRIKLVTPGGKGNPVEHYYGETFGATFTFDHIGPAMTLDMGWVLHCGENYVWALALNVSIPAHETKTQITKALNGIFAAPGLSVGQTISAQAVISKQGDISGNTAIAIALGNVVTGQEPIITPKMDSHLADVKSILEGTFPDVYQYKGASATGQISGLSIGGIR